MTMHYDVRITWEDGRSESFTKETKWNENSLRAWLVRKYPDSQIIYITETGASAPAAAAADVLKLGKQMKVIPIERPSVDLPALARRREAAFHEWRNALAYGYLDECRRLHTEMDDIKAKVKAEIGFEIVDHEWSALAGEKSQVDITDEQFAQVNDAAAMLAAARGE